MALLAVHRGEDRSGISELQEEYGIRRLNTVRAAQQRLAEKGLLEARQGVGAFVVGTESLTALDVHEELAQIRDRLSSGPKRQTDSGGRSMSPCEFRRAGPRRPRPKSTLKGPQWHCRHCTPTDSTDSPPAKSATATISPDIGFCRRPSTQRSSPGTKRCGGT
ncbi:GntR family transcriptional regulator [Rhodococcus sp. WS4]|nr:GntR family transcriptional regulator [Rhodococcus sp. WS4]